MSDITDFLNSKAYSQCTKVITVITAEAIKYISGMINYILSYPGVYLLACLVMVFILTVSGVGLSFVVWLREE